MDRRHFLGGLMAASCASFLLPLCKLAPSIEAAKSKKVGKGKIDENLVVFISDLHTNPNGYHPDKIRRCVADILKMTPLPRNVIALGDLAYLRGKEEEYQLLRELFKPLDGTGIQLTLGMGNHDRRDNFAKIFPEYAQQTLVPGKMVFKVETPKAVIFVVDSVSKGNTEADFIVAGTMDKAQKEWLKKELAACTKPAFVTCHHSIAETSLQKILLDSPTCCGYIHGHDHRWRKDWFKKDYSHQQVIRTLCLPSVSHWGDIGYTTMQLGDEGAVTQLREYEFFFPVPAKPGEKEPAVWKKIKEEYDKATCYFPYRGF